MGLRELNLPIHMDTSKDNLDMEFYIPLLASSILYKRGVGFFSSGWLSKVSRGLLELVKNNGKVQIITSPILDKNDYDALLKGETMKKHVIEKSINKSIEKLAKDLEEDVLSALAWLVADNILEFKLAVPRNKLEGDFHDKFGIFIDEEGDMVAFIGSPNESIRGFENYESIKIFPSWRDTTSREIAENENNRFDILWNDEDPNISVYTLPKAARDKIIKLRTKPRPYKLQKSSLSETKLPPPRPYQKEAVKNWIENNYKGIFEMATGTGKTLTALYAIKEILKVEKNVIINVVVPYVHLVDQWENEINRLSSNIVKCYGNKQEWIAVLKSKLLELKLEPKGPLFIITTYSTASKEDLPLLELLSEYSKHKKIALILDEAHYAGAPEFSKVLNPKFIYRIGLSATPTRIYDEVGNKNIEEYFTGPKGSIVYSFPIWKAIDNGYLTPYKYYPVLVEMSSMEFEQYKSLTQKIIKIKNNKNLSEDEKNKRIQQALLTRANLIKEGESKLETLRTLVKENKEKGKIKHALFYCDSHQLDKVIKILHAEGIVAVKFTAHENAEQRRNILKDFEDRKIDAIVAIKCLDEGVDIPPTRFAYFLASDANPRQFIQRRGRILRRYPGKQYAEIYDFVVIPPKDIENKQIAKDILRKELSRFKEFSEHGLNKYESRSILLPLLKGLNMLGELG